VTEIFMELEQSHRWHDEAGQALVEYSFILVMVAVVCFAALQFIGGDVSAVFQQVANGFPGV
jgi:Flp pilus assembly pilin Flp